MAEARRLRTSIRFMLAVLILGANLSKGIYTIVLFIYGFPGCKAHGSCDISRSRQDSKEVGIGEDFSSTCSIIMKGVDVLCWWWWLAWFG